MQIPLTPMFGFEGVKINKGRREGKVEKKRKEKKKRKKKRHFFEHSTFEILHWYLNATVSNSHAMR